jgi:DNA-binding transcriptional MerR regulator
MLDKRKARRWIKEGRKRKWIAAQLGVSVSTLRRFERAEESATKAGLQRAEAERVAEIERKIADLRREQIRKANDEEEAKYQRALEEVRRALRK